MVYRIRKSHERETESKRERERDRRLVIEEKIFLGSVTNRLFE